MKRALSFQMPSLIFWSFVSLLEFSLFGGSRAAIPLRLQLAPTNRQSPSRSRFVSLLLVFFSHLTNSGIRWLSRISHSRNFIIISQWDGALGWGRGFILTVVVQFGVWRVGIVVSS